MQKELEAQKAQMQKELEAQVEERVQVQIRAMVKAQEAKEAQVQAQKELEAQVQGRGGGKAPRKMLFLEYAQPSTHTANPAFQGQVRGHAKRKSAGGKAKYDEPEEPASMSCESSCDDVIQWLLWKKLRKIADVFEDHNIDGHALATITEIELDRMGISSLGARLTILEMAKQLSPVNPARRTHAHTHTHTHMHSKAQNTHTCTQI